MKLDLPVTVYQYKLRFEAFAVVPYPVVTQVFEAAGNTREEALALLTAKVEEALSAIGVKEASRDSIVLRGPQGELATLMDAARERAAVAVNLMASAQREVRNTAVYTPHYSMPSKQDPPHLVVVRMRKCLRGRGRAVSDVGKTVCQLRRYDNDRWLWTSRPYAHGELSLRDAHKTAELYGWRIVAEAEDSAHLAAESAEDGLPVSEEKQEPTEAPQVEAETPAPDVARTEDRPDLLLLLRGIATHLTKAAKSDARHSETLSEIAVLVEKGLDLEVCSLWPDKEVPDLDPDTKLKLWEMQNLLILIRRGDMEINIGVQRVAARLEKTLGLAEGAIWPEGCRAPNSMDAKLIELVRAHEKLLAFVVSRLGHSTHPVMTALLADMCEQVKSGGFQETLQTMTFRHMDTRDAFNKVEAQPHD